MFENLIAKLKAERRSLVLPEGSDLRIIEGAEGL